MTVPRAAERRGCGSLRNRGRFCEEDGVTLAEVLVVLVILGVVLAAMSVLFVASTTAQADQSNRFRAQQDARAALEALRREIRCASAVGTPTTSTPFSSLTITLRAYCPTGGTTLTSALTIPLSAVTSPPTSTYTVSVRDTSAFADSGPWMLRIGRRSGEITCTSKGATTFSGCTKGSTATGVNPYPVGSRVTGVMTYMWCVKDAAGASPPLDDRPPYSLWRYAGSACSGTGTRRAENLISIVPDPVTSAPTPTGKIFRSYTASGGGNLGRLAVKFSVDVDPDDPRQRYTLKDDIVLRNTPR